MKRLWAPWRSQYVANARKDTKTCMFCDKGRRTGRDAQDLMLTRAAAAYSLLNLFPYNTGHAMVVPYRHAADLSELTEEEWVDMWRLATDLLKRMRKVFSPDGFNIGINLGRAAGAGIPGHLHLHIVPRWIGDANFMPILSDTRVISRSLDAARKLLVAAGGKSKAGRRKSKRRP